MSHFYQGDPGTGYEGAGTQCYECSIVSEGEELECPNCGAEEIGPVEISACPSPSDCNDDNHHFGRGDHVKDVPR